MIHYFLHAAVLASSLWLDRRAKASRSMKPRSTRRNLMARSISPFPCFINFYVHTDLEVMMFDALDMSCMMKHSVSNHVVSSVHRAVDIFPGLA
eukprot:244918-Pyramimonas_sp.AAC.1